MQRIKVKQYGIGLSVLVFSLVFLAVSFFIRFSNEQELKHLKQMIVQQKGMNAQSKREMSVLQSYSVDYDLYREKGVIGAANKLNWIEVLDSVSKDIGIYDVQFTIEDTRKIVEDETPFYHYEIPIYVTDMFLDLSLLHEGDIYRLLEEMTLRAKGMFSVQSCQIQRIGDAGKQLLYDGLKGKCHLRWFNLEDVTEKWSEYE